MTGEQLGKRGLWQALAGGVLIAWVAVFAATTEVGNPPLLLAAAVSGGLVCLCAVAGGLVATRITDAASAARLRHVFVVLDAASLAIFFPFYWFGHGIEPAGRPGEFALGIVLVATVPVFAALVLVMRCSRAVHKIVVADFGPLVPDSGTGAPVQRIKVLATVLITAGVALSAGAVAVVFTTPSAWLPLPVLGLLVMLMPVLLGLSLMRVQDVYSARRRSVGLYLVVPAACGFAVAKFASIGGVLGMLFGALACGAVLLLVIALVVMREYTGEWDRPWRERKRAISR